jgi:hypothetical protein
VDGLLGGSFFEYRLENGQLPSWGGRPPHSLLGGPGKLDWNEVFFRIKIVFARLIDDSNLAQLGRDPVSDNLIKLAQFKRGGVILVLNTNDKSRFSSLH